MFQESVARIKTVDSTTLLEDEKTCVTAVKTRVFSEGKYLFAQAVESRYYQYFLTLLCIQLFPFNWTYSRLRSFYSIIFPSRETGKIAEARRLAGLRVLFGAVQLNPRGLISTGVVPLNLRGLSETGCNGVVLVQWASDSEPVTVTATLRLPTSTFYKYPILPYPSNKISAEVHRIL